MRALGSCYLQQIHALSQLQGAHVALHAGRIGLEDTCRTQVCLLVLPLASMFPESTDLFIHKAEMMTSDSSYSGVNVVQPQQEELLYD